MLIFYLKNILKITKIILIRIYNNYYLKKNIHWNIAFFRCAFDKINLKNIVVIKNPKSRWFADPFFIKRNKKHYIFFEDYDIKKKIGAISCVELNKNNSIKFHKNIIKEKFHLSFPFLFKFNNELYLIPETSVDKSIKLYKCTKFPNKWVFVKNLINDINCVDTIIFKHQKFWYLLTCMMSKKNIYNKLVGYYSKNPIEVKWNIIKKFPLVSEYNGGRNGGIIHDSLKNIYRVGQIQLPGRYGYGHTINRLIKISKDNYKEQCLKNQFNDLNNLGHVHTINSKNNFTVIDFSVWK